VLEYAARISSFYWIGAARDVDGSVKWVTNEESDYTRFISYLENDTPEKETPVLMWSNTAFWETCEKADDDTGFICEWEKKPTITFNRHKYKLFNYSTNWDDAAEYCEKLGGHLVTITSEEEQSFVCDLLNSSTKDYCWLGGYRSQTKGFE
jgi:hypothetical protein